MKGSRFSEIPVDPVDEISLFRTLYRLGRAVPGASCCLLVRLMEQALSVPSASMATKRLLRASCILVLAGVLLVGCSSDTTGPSGPAELPEAVTTASVAADSGSKTAQTTVVVDTGNAGPAFIVGDVPTGDEVSVSCAGPWSRTITNAVPEIASSVDTTLNEVVEAFSLPHGDYYITKQPSGEEQWIIKYDDEPGSDIVVTISVGEVLTADGLGMSWIPYGYSFCPPSQSN